jgi:cell division protein FtsZ
MAAEAALPQITEMLKGKTKMAFITAGMGGGTGTGASPVIAKACYDAGLLTVGIVTIPFGFEPRKKMRQAISGIEAMSAFVDALLVIRNDQIPEVAEYKNKGLEDFMKAADNVLSNATRGIVEIITKHGYVNVDFADVYATLHDGKRTVMNTGIASGERRVIDAIEDALESPLLFNFDIQKTKKLLFAFYTSKTHQITAEETKQINEFMRKNKLDDEIDFIWGAFYDPDLDDEVKVTVLASGADKSVMPTELNDNFRDEDCKNDSIKGDNSPLKIFDEEEKLREYQEVAAYKRALAV